ncbi:methylmalonyl-CoA mutase subunit beta [Flavobacterium branchiophilum]|uniref:Methylmalonyl-CoA mutase n=1 Tax=Flavobacterium branchiophilum TaxID=55197 RepID=A0A2H3KBV4_9FLAO|nr:methylmalonyl-CoA mutase subunit beta [Flavobacterium branchiophilum]PDS24639.1 methylmalonyl-CoA mutase [Flavobacterium branchiophilum]
MPQQLFSDFEAVSSKQWKNQLQYELKGADYNDTLVWNSPEDIKVKPFYHQDEFEKPYPIGTNVTEFKIGQAIFVQDVLKSIQKATDSLNRGAESLHFVIENDQTDIEKLLLSLSLAHVPVFFDLSFLSIDFVLQIDRIAVQNNLTIYCNIDPIGQLAKEGNWFETAEQDNFETLNKLVSQTQKVILLGVHAGLYQNAGANMVQQIAYTLAHANEYLNIVKTYKNTIVLHVAVGTNYFFEIAKLRALRLLFNLLAKEYHSNITCHIVATPSHRNKTIYDYNVNMLRTTTECMSAILGGANTVINLPYDALYHKNNEFGDRISRNQLLIMKNESYFDKVNNPADGSYYIENITQQLAEKSLALFKDIEANGGFLKQLNDGTIKRKIQESADKEQALFDSGKEVLLGTNKYPNPKDQMKHDLELYPFVKNNPRKTLIAPIIEKRLSEKLEQDRLALE